MIDEDNLRKHHELYGKLQNEYRQTILAYCYGEPRSYSDLIDKTGLKPGSLYHHLGILDPLVIKSSRGQYSITPLGKEIAEEFDLIEELKPDVIQENDGSNNKFETEITNSVSPPTGLSTENLLEQIWLLWPSYIIVILTLIIAIWLAFYGVAVAGSAIYAVGNAAYIFDLSSIFLGLLLLYTIESITFQNPPHHRFKFTITIRIISMAPATIVGLGLLILYTQGISVPDPVFPWLFAVTTTLGTLLASTGIQFLRGVTYYDALLWAALMTGVDLLLGLVVLLI